MNKHLILLIATVLLIVSLISAGTLGWFMNNDSVSVKNIKVSTRSISEVVVTATSITYVVPTGYATTGLAPGCLGYFGLNLSNIEGSANASVTVSINFSKCKVPSNLQFYKGAFNTSDATLPTDHNSKWTSGKYVKTDKSSTVTLFSNVQVSKFNSKVVNVAFFWPYNSPSTSTQKQEDTNYGIGTTKDFVINLTITSVSS